MEAVKELLASVPQGVQAAFAAVGLLYVAARLLASLGFFLDVFVLGGTNLRKYGGKGSWAVVTGASDGIGKEFAVQLAAKGFSLVLVSRTASKLEALAKDIGQRFGGAGVQVRTLAMDFSDDKDDDYERLGRLIEGLDVGILINNVGQSHSMPVPFLQTERRELQDIVTINCLGTLKTTQVVARKLVQRKRGLILTMGSMGGWMPTPYLATYSGSKAFLQHWNSSLAAELKPSGVDAYLVLSYLVVSAMSKIRRPSLLIPTPKGFVRSALAKVGSTSQAFAYTSTPYWTHALFQWAVENTIGVGHRLGIWYNMKMHQDIRTRALKKAAREAKKS